MSTHTVKSLLIHVVLLIVFTGVLSTQAQEANNDTTIVLSDSTLQDSLSPAVNTNDHYLSPNATNVQMEYSSERQKVMDAKNNLIHLYYNAWVKYGSVELKAGKITIDANNNTVYAEGILDSNGVLIQTPVFNDNGVEYTANKMAYNTETGKGQIIEARTMQKSGADDTYITGKIIKKMDEKVAFVKNGSFTTCDADHPHYAILSSKLKMIQDKKIVTGPAMMTIGDVPTPLVIPFGFFPNSQSASSGIIFPSFGSDVNRGLFIQDLGYYIPISDKLDQTFYGTYYTNNSYGLKSYTNYKSKYKYYGNFNFELNRIINGDSEFDSDTTTSQRITWKHVQDPKMSTYSSFGANVNINTNKNNKNDPNSSDDDYLSSTFLSNISYTHQFGESPFSLSLNARHSTNSNTDNLSVDLPSGSINMARIFPFQRKNAVGDKKFYENIGINYTNQFRGAYNETTTDPFPSDFFDELELGVNQTIQASTNFKMAKYFNFSPSYTYQEIWYGSQTIYDFDATDSIIDTTIVKGFNRFNRHQFAMSVSSKIYGMYNFKKGKVKAIRHTMTPSVSFSYSPASKGADVYTGDFYNPTYEEYEEYSYFDGYMYSTPVNSESGRINFSLQNSVEMKYQSKADTLGDGEFTKTSLIDRLNITTSYDILADSLNWSDVSVSFGNKLLNNRMNITASSRFSLYDVDSLGRDVNTFLWESQQKLFFVENVSFTASLKLNKDSKSEFVNYYNDLYLNEQERIIRETYSQDYVDFNVPWDMTLSYSHGYNYNRASTGSKVSRSNAIEARGNVSLTENFKMTFRSGFDFENNEMTYTTIGFMRDLHCWQMSIDAVPFGERTRFTFNIHVKAGMLKDLKYEMNRQEINYN